MSDEKSTPGSDESTETNTTGDISRDVPAQEPFDTERDESAAPIWDDAATPSTQFVEQAPPPLQEPAPAGRAAWPTPVESPEPAQAAPSAETAAPADDREPEASPATAGEIVDEPASGTDAQGTPAAHDGATSDAERDTATHVAPVIAPAHDGRDAHVVEDPTPAEIRAGERHTGEPAAHDGASAGTAATAGAAGAAASAGAAPAAHPAPAASSGAAPAAHSAPAASSAAAPAAHPAPAAQPAPAQQPAARFDAPSGASGDFSQVVYVREPVPPKKRGNRLAGALFALLGTIAFALLYLGVGALLIAVSVPSQFLAQQISEFITLPSYWIPLAVFLVLHVGSTLLLNRAGWWAHVVVSLLVGLVTYFAVIGIVLLSADVIGMTPGQAYQQFIALAGNPFIIASGIVAREVALWFGLATATSGKRVKARNAADREQWEAEQAERRAEYDRAQA